VFLHLSLFHLGKILLYHLPYRHLLDLHPFHHLL